MHVFNTIGAGYSGEKYKWKGCMWNRWRGKKKKCLGEFRYTLVSLVSKTQCLCRPPSCSLLATPSCSSISSAPACISFHTKDNSLLTLNVFSYFEKVLFFLFLIILNIYLNCFMIYLLSIILNIFFSMYVTKQSFIQWYITLLCNWFFNC